MTPSIEENLDSVQRRIETAARKAGRELDEITLVAVSKKMELKTVKKAYKAGIRVFGENYIQEAQEKIGKVKKGSAKWHFIGHLQKNKAKFAVEMFDMIETVDSVELAKMLNKHTTKPLDILISVNLAREESKSGFFPPDLIGAVKEIHANFKNLNIRGLMAIPPAFEDPEMSRPYFTTLRRLAETVNKEKLEGLNLTEISMGMSNDYDVAIEEGATIVRIGTAIFGPREPAKPVPAKEDVTAKKVSPKKPAKVAAPAKPVSAKEDIVEKPKKAAPAAKKKKTPAKKAVAPKKAAAPKKKTAAKKAAPKKPAAKKAAPVKKKKAPSKKATAKKAAPAKKKPVSKKKPAKRV